MQASMKFSLPLVIWIALPALAGEPARPVSDAPRELLQPPKQEIASPITDRFAIRALYIGSDINTVVRYDSAVNVQGTLVDAETDIGFPSHTNQPGLDLSFRMGERNRIHADFYKMRRSGDLVLGQQIDFGQAVYLAGDRLLSNTDLRMLGFSWTWSALKFEKFELGLGLGLHLMQVHGQLEVPARFVRQRLDAAGPFPTGAFDATWRMTKRFSVNLAANYLGGSLNGVDGKFQSLHADLQFRVRPNFALGAGYDQSQFRFDSRTTDFIGYFNLKYQGPEAFLRVSF